MGDVNEEAERCFRQTLVAALLVKPLDPGLTLKEMEEVVTQSGFSVPVARDVLPGLFRARNVLPDRMVSLKQEDLWNVFRHFDNDYPEELFPLEAVRELARAFDELDRDMSKPKAKSLAILEAKCANQSGEAVQRALGFMLALKTVKAVDGGFIRQGDFEGEIRPQATEGKHPWIKPVLQLKSIVELVLARRDGVGHTTESPVDRFGRFLKKQGWLEFARWWAMSTQEMRTLGEHHPIASTVLAGALLEAALVAIAAPAKEAGQWNQGWLNDPPQKWQMHKLIQQAESAGTFNSSDMHMATTVAEFRNRIHAGQFSPTWRGPFVMPHTDAHQARITHDNLEHLLERILRWPPVLLLA
jgi:hypothetical protein